MKGELQLEKLQENIRLLDEILALLRLCESSPEEPGNRERFEIARQAAVDMLWSLHTLVRELRLTEPLLR